MVIDTAAIQKYFAKLGLEPEVADIYLALHTYGPQSISELSRNAKVERTRIYRLIDHLMESNLIEIESHYKRGIIKAAPIANLHILINEKEQELKNLQDELGLIEQVLARNSLSNPATRVQMYYGPEGIRQMRRNQLRAKDKQSVGYATQIYEELAGNAFNDRWGKEFDAKNLHRRLIVDEHFVQSWQRRKPASRKINGYECRGVDPSVFTIAENCDVYDNITSYFQHADGEMFGVEIYNQHIADTQRQLFEIIWAQSTPETRI